MPASLSNFPRCLWLVMVEGGIGKASEDFKANIAHQLEKVWSHRFFVRKYQDAFITDCKSYFISQKVFNFSIDSWPFLVTKSYNNVQYNNGEEKLNMMAFYLAGVHFIQRRTSSIRKKYHIRAVHTVLFITFLYIYTIIFKSINCYLSFSIQLILECSGAYPWIKTDLMSSPTSLTWAYWGKIQSLHLLLMWGRWFCRHHDGCFMTKMEPFGISYMKG